MKEIFEPNREKYDGIRPINIYGMRLLYVLMSTLLAFQVWSHIFTYDQQWDPSDAMNWSVWAAFTIFAFIGIFRTIKMIPILLLEIVYKVMWLILVALPLYLEGNLSDETTDGMIFPFLLVILAIAVVPWGYVFNNYIKSGN